jgi:hypothetical protein
MALMAAAGEIMPMPDCAIFADTQAEPQSVYVWLDWLEKQLPFRVHRVTAGNLEERVLRIQRSKKSGKLYSKTLIPVFMLKPNGKAGMLQRRCTGDYKLKPIIRLVTQLTKPPRMSNKNPFPEILAKQWIGISLDEAHRMKPPLRAWIENRYPLIDLRMTRADCLAWIESRGFPKPPRSACKQCPYHSDAEWLRLKTEEPEDFAAAVEWERKYQIAIEKDEVTEGIPFLHDSLITLDKVNFNPTLDKADQFGNECEGMCGV